MTKTGTVSAPLKEKTPRQGPLRSSEVPPKEDRAKSGRREIVKGKKEKKKISKQKKIGVPPLL